MARANHQSSPMTGNDPHPHYVFFLGCHRTGSKTLANFFAGLAPRAYSVHQRGQHRWLNIASSMCLAKVMPPVVFKALARRWLLAPLASAQAPWIVETNGHNYLAAHYLKDRLPPYPVVQVVRDPRSFITSMVNWRLTRSGKARLVSHLPFWDLNAFWLGQMSWQRWRGLSFPARLAWHWTYKNQLIRHLYGRGQGPFLLVRFEDIFMGPQARENLGQVLEFVGLPGPWDLERILGRKQNASPGRVFPSWSSWSPELCRQVDELCQPLLGELGYGREPQWLALLEQG